MITDRRGAALVCLVLLLAGCTSMGAHPAPEASTPSAADRQQWVLPLDGYIRSPGEWTAGTYAENLLVSECMAAAGISWQVPHIDVDQPLQATRSPSGRRIFNLQIAQQFGYREPARFSVEVEAAMAALNEALPASEQAMLDGCIATARVTLPLPEDSQLGVRLANQALEEAAGDGEVQAAAGRWRSCMQPEGISDLPAMPEGGSEAGMPTPSQAARFGVDGSDPGIEEVAQAVADATCRDSSGFSVSLYAAEWRLQSAALAAHADDLVRDRDALARYMVAVRQVLTDRGQL